jgi:hypothetical protein
MTRPTPSPAPRRFQLTAFGIGVLIGLPLPVLLGAGVLSLFAAQDGEGRPRGYNVEVISRGAALSAHGAARMVVRSERGAVVEACRDGCDDLRLRETSTDNGYRVEVWDAGGAGVACGGVGYVTTGAGLSRMVVAGDDRLTVRSISLRKTPTGAVEERAFPPEGAEGCGRRLAGD